MDQNKPLRKRPDFLRRVVELREHAGEGDLDQADARTEQGVEGEHPRGRLPGVFGLSGAQKVPDDDGCGVAHRQENHAGHLGDGARNIVARHNHQPPLAIAAGQHRHGGRPENLVQHQRQALADGVAGQLRLDVQLAVDAADIGMAVAVPVRVDGDNRAFRDPGDHRRNGGAGHAEGRQPQLAEDQQVVQPQIDHHGGAGGPHRHDGFAGLAERGGVDLLDGKGQKAEKHDPQIGPGAFERQLQISGLLVVEPGPDQAVAKENKYRRPKQAEGQAGEQLEPESLAHAPDVAAAMELADEDARPGRRAEEGDVEHKHELVDNGDAGHLLRADAADHHIVQQADEVGHAVLQHNRQRQRQHIAVKAFFIPPFYGNPSHCVIARYCTAETAGRQALISYVFQPFSA